MPHLTLAYSALKAAFSKDTPETSLSSRLGLNGPGREFEEHEVLDPLHLLGGVPKQDVHKCDIQAFGTHPSCRP